MLVVLMTVVYIGRHPSFDLIGPRFNRAGRSLAFSDVMATDDYDGPVIIGLPVYTVVVVVVVVVVGSVSNWHRRDVNVRVN